MSNPFRTKRERERRARAMRFGDEAVGPEPMKLWVPREYHSATVYALPPPLYTDGFGRVLPLVARELNDVWAKDVEEKQASSDQGSNIASIVHYGGIMATGFNLASTTIGTGVLSIPSAMHATGIYIGVLYLVIVGLLTIYSYTLLGAAGMRTGHRSYEQNMAALIGPGAAVFAAFILVAYCFGTLVSYIKSISVIMEVLFKDTNENLVYLQTVEGRRFITSMFWMSCMLPMCLPQHRNSLRFFSFIAVSLMMVFTVFVVIHATQNGLSAGVRPDISLVQYDNKAIAGISTFIFSYMSQINSFGVFAELHRPSVRRLTLSSTLCVGLAFIMYLLVGVFGYLDFGPSVASVSALKLYDPANDLMMAVGYFMIAFKVCVGYGLHMMPLRDGVYYLFRTDAHSISFALNGLIVIVIASLSLLVAFFIPNVNIVVDFVGGMFGGFVVYVFPALMAMYTGDFTRRTVGMWHYVGVHTLLFAGVAAVTFGSCGAIYDYSTS